MKGLDISISLVVILMIGVVLLIVIGGILTGNISGLEEFVGENLNIVNPSETSE